MSDFVELRRLAEAANAFEQGESEDIKPLIAFHDAANPAVILSLLDRVAALQDELEHLREDPYQNRHIDAEQRVAALEEGLRMMVEVFADGSGVHSAAAAYCTLSDEGHASIAKARALLSEGDSLSERAGQVAEGER